MKSVSLCKWFLLVFVVIVCSGFVSVPCCAQTYPSLDNFWESTAHWVYDSANNQIGPDSFKFLSMIWVGNEIWAYYIDGYDDKYITRRARSTDGVNWTIDNFYVLDVGGVPKSGWSWEAQSGSFGHQVGRSEGDGWEADTGNDPVSGWLCYGPYTTAIPYGPFDAQFNVMIDNNSADNAIVAYIDVNDYDASQILAYKYITRREFTSTYTYQKFHLNFYPGASNHRLEYRTYWYRNNYIKEKCVEVAEGYYPQWDNTCASFPGICYVNGQYYLVYEGSVGGVSGSIGLATSTNGTDFSRSFANPILSKSALWESHNIGTPSLSYAGSNWYLYYHGYDYTDCRIGVATGSDILSLTKSDYNPIVNTVDGTWEAGTCGKRSTVLTGPSGDYYMAYEGSEDQQPGSGFGTAKWSTGLARSSDRINWTKYSNNPIVPQTSGGFGNDGPELIVIGGVTYLYVRSPDTGSKRYILVWN